MSLTFDGHNLESLFICGDPQITILNSQPDTRDVSGRNGTVFIGMTYGVSTVSFTIAVDGTAADRRASFSTLGQWLKVDEPKKLVLHDTSDRYYLAVPSEGLDLQRAIGSEYTTLTFMLTDPVAYGSTERSATMPADSSLSITIGGTAPTYLRIRSTSSVRDSTSLVWGVKVDNSKIVHVATGTDSTRTIEVDSEKRTCKVASSLKAMTLDSDWIQLNPGTHTVALDNGTGNVTVYWRERWY